jgi:hypothetical protein
VKEKQKIGKKIESAILRIEKSKPTETRFERTKASNNTIGERKTKDWKKLNRAR